MKRLKKPHNDYLTAPRWETLKAGDIVDIVAPGWACSREELANSIQALKAWGLVPRVPKDIFGKTFQLSNTDKVRVKHLKTALLAPDSKAIWCLRGGYGSIRLLHELNKIKQPARCKLFIGYSDITTLHLFFNFFWRWPTVHGPLFDRIGRGDLNAVDMRRLKQIIFGKISDLKYSGLKPRNHPARSVKKISSTVVGGNMTVVQSGLATPWQVSLRGKIVVFEDVGERPHRIDRMLTQMQQAGFFNGARGIIFADFKLGNKTEQKKIFSDIIDSFAASVRVPVWSGLKSGHGPINNPLPFMVPAQIKKNSIHFSW